MYNTLLLRQKTTDSNICLQRFYQHCALIYSLFIYYTFCIQSINVIKQQQRYHSFPRECGYQNSNCLLKTLSRCLLFKFIESIEKLKIVEKNNGDLQGVKTQIKTTATVTCSSVFVPDTLQ